MLDIKLQNLLTAFEDIEDNLQYNELEHHVKHRIWYSEEKTAGGRINSPTDLHVSGKLESSFNISNGVVSAESYAAAVERKYGKIFDLSDEEIEFFKLYITKTINENVRNT